MTRTAFIIIGVLALIAFAVLTYWFGLEDSQATDPAVKRYFAVRFSVFMTLVAAVAEAILYSIIF